MKFQKQTDLKKANEMLKNYEQQNNRFYKLLWDFEVLVIDFRQVDKDLRGLKQKGRVK